MSKSGLVFMRNWFEFKPINKRSHVKPKQMCTCISFDTQVYYQSVVLYMYIICMVFSGCISDSHSLGEKLEHTFTKRCIYTHISIIFGCIIQHFSLYVDNQHQHFSTCFFFFFFFWKSRLKFAGTAYSPVGLIHEFLW